MGGGSWTSSAYTSYATSSYGLSDSDISDRGITKKLSNQDIYKATKLNEALNPHKVLRECCDSDEHPCTIPVILALDVTGSMGDAATEVAKSLNNVMTQLYSKIKDVEFMIMGIGDLDYDNAPIQASQFESDIRIASQMDKIYFEFGGGGNQFESYTAAWYFGLHNTKLDCFDKRGKKGIIITLGDEPMNTYLPCYELNKKLGSNEQSDVETDKLYQDASKKFDIYHIQVSHNGWCDSQRVRDTWKLLGDNYRECTINAVPDTIIEIIKSVTESSNTVTDDSIFSIQRNENNEIVW